jgi:hypothetical protein
MKKRVRLEARSGCRRFRGLGICHRVVGFKDIELSTHTALPTWDIQDSIDYPAGRKRTSDGHGGQDSPLISDRIRWPVPRQSLIRYAKCGIICFRWMNPPKARA